MEALGIIYAIVTILAWGSWLVPSQNVKFANEQRRNLAKKGRMAKTQ